MPRKRILQIIPTLDRCGAEKQMVLLASHLPRNEFEVEVIALTRSGPLAGDLSEAGIPMTLIGKHLKVDPWAYSRLKREIRRIAPDLVHTWLFAANAYGRRAALSCGVKHLVAGERCVDPWKNRLQFFVDRRLARRTDRIATNSEGVKDFYVRHGLPGEKFVVIPNAVIPPESTETSLTVSQLLDETGVPAIPPRGDYHPVYESSYDSDAMEYRSTPSESEARQRPYLIGVVARLWPQKRIKDLLWVCETLKIANLNYHAFIIGDGPERDHLLWCRDQWKLSDRVHFLGQRNDVARLMPCFDVLLNASAYEGQSNSILEAMSFGVPVIATDIPGNRDLVVDGETGLLVPDCGEDFRLRRRTFSEKTRWLLENGALRNRMGEAARERIAESFSLDRMIDRYAELYREILGTSDTEIGRGG